MVNMQDELSDKNVTKKKKKNLQICLEKEEMEKMPQTLWVEKYSPRCITKCFLNYFLKSTFLISDYLDQSIELIISTNH